MGLTLCGQKKSDPWLEPRININTNLASEVNMNYAPCCHENKSPRNDPGSWLERIARLLNLSSEVA